MIPGRILLLITAFLGTGLAADEASLSPRVEATLRRIFEQTRISTPCAVTPLGSSLDYSLRYQSRFNLDLPPGGSGVSHRYIIALRITPESGQPVYFASRVEAPHASGSFETEAGHYKVELLLGDIDHDVCRSSWTIDIKPNASTRGLEPKAVATANQPLTILVNLMPPAPGDSAIPADDAQKLLGSLFALVSHSVGRCVRVVVFDLDQQKVLMTKDSFTTDDVGRVEQLVNRQRYGVVDYSALQRPAGGSDLLAELTEKESARMGVSGMLVFLGSPGGLGGSIRTNTLKKLPDAPRIFYLDCMAPMKATAHNDASFSPTADSSAPPVPVAQDSLDDIDSQLPDLTREAMLSPVPNDIIGQLVKRLKGQVIAIRTPADCARAIRRLASFNVARR